ncbi:MAG TPA: hypothetical protein VHE83_04635 [Mycobacteriales bacterium]|nr:hypothetical protein [Mycobacteriales bacterium]
MGDTDFRTDADRQAAHDAEKLDEQVKGADGGPIDEQDMKAADGLTTPPGVDKAYQEALERGAHQKGEGAPEA